MLECFDLAEPCSEKELWTQYQKYYRILDSIEIAVPLKEALLLALNDAYDGASQLTEESRAAAASPARSR
jgi:hypothetical protein